MIEQLAYFHKDQILKLYQDVAKFPGGIARIDSEITPAYIEDNIQKSLNSGLGFVYLDGTQCVGSIHAYSLEVDAFAHVLKFLTIVIHPDYQSKGIGRQLFQHFLDAITDSPYKRVELFVRASNIKAIALYKSLGFQEEGLFKNRIKTIHNSYEDDIAMAWICPKK